MPLMAQYMSAFIKENKFTSEEKFYEKYEHPFLIVDALRVMADSGTDYFTWEIPVDAVTENASDSLMEQTHGESPMAVFLEMKASRNKSIITLGRVKENDIMITSRDVSKFHAYLEVKDDGWYIYDQHSTNGTTADGKPVGKVDPFGPFTAQTAILLGEAVKMFFHNPQSMWKQIRSRLDP